MIQIRKEDNQKKQKEKKLKVYKVNTHKKTVIALWVLLAVSFLFAVYKNFTAIDIHTCLLYTSGTGRFTPCKSAPNPVYGQHRNAPNRK